MYRLDPIAERLARLGAHAGDPDDTPRAAVAAILREPTRDADAELLFIRRAEHPKDPWSGHVAFPGGRVDPGDVTLLETAIRETREELAIDLDHAELVARLPDIPAFIRSKRGTLVVTPFVFAVRRGVVPVPNSEVAATMWIPLARFAHGVGRGTYTFTWEGNEYKLPCFHLPSDDEPDVPTIVDVSAATAKRPVLWGLTFRMVETILETLSPDVTLE